MNKETKRARVQDIVRAIAENSDPTVVENGSRVSGGTLEMNEVVQRLLDSFGARIEPAGLLLAHARVGWKSDASPTEVAETLERLGLFARMPSVDSQAPENLPIVK
jgi:hypothetical protein